MSIENPNLGNEPQQEQNSGEQSSLDESLGARVFREQKEKERANMTPEQLAKDNKFEKQAEEFKKFHEREKIKKTGTPEQKRIAAEEEAEEKIGARKEIDALIAKAYGGRDEIKDALEQRRKDNLAKAREEFKKKHGIYPPEK